MKNAIIGLAFLVVVAGAGFLGVKYASAQRQLKKLSNPTEAAKAESEALVVKVGKIVDLPSETPTVATIVDASKLKSQPFFENAANDDKVLMYTTAKKAYLYRPSTNKIIEIAPINVGTPTGAPAQPAKK